MDFFSYPLTRLKHALRVSKDQEVAEALGLSKTAFSERKKRGAFPDENLRVLAAKRPELGIDVDYVLTGIRHNKDEAMQRLKLQLQVEDDEQVAELLGLSASALADSPHIPIKAVFALAAKRPDLGLDPDLIVTGTSRKMETAGTLEVKITAHEMALIDRYRLSHQDVQRGVDALLAVTAKQDFQK